MFFCYFSLIYEVLVLNSQCLGLVSGSILFGLDIVLASVNVVLTSKHTPILEVSSCDGTLADV